VERENKEVLRHLRAFVYDKNILEEWQLYLPLVQRIINATVHSRIGVTPATLLYGPMINLNRNVILTREEVVQF
jgi:hypothetical protein